MQEYSHKRSSIRKRKNCYRYNDFKEWLEDNDIDTLYKVENILKTDAPKWWNEFETNISRSSKFV